MHLSIRTTEPEGVRKGILELIAQRIKQAQAAAKNFKKLKDKHCAMAEVWALASLQQEIQTLRIEAP